MENVFTVSTLTNDNTYIQFISNSAEHNGGAMYINLVSEHCNVFNSILVTSVFSFINNSAGIAGNSIYFSIPRACQIVTDINNTSSLLYYPNKFDYTQPKYNRYPPVVTSPYNIKLFSSAFAIHNSTIDYPMQQKLSKMLGEPIQFTASVLDYFNNITEPVVFSINCKNCDNDYVLSAYQITVHDQSIYELKIFPKVYHDVVSNTNVSIKLFSVLPSVYKLTYVLLSVELSSCRAGYFFDKTQRQCFCHPYSDLVNCKRDFVEIKIGYWIGYLTKEHYTSSICPNNYCSSEHPETSPGYYSLHGKPDDQCSSHRTGVACSECKSGYTLAYDSPDCINTDKCSTGMTILVIVLTILYWIAIVAVVLGLMCFQFQISSGYAYGIIYH